MIKKIIYKILEIQEKILRARLSKTIGVKNSSKKKRVYSNGCTIDLSSLADKDKQLLEENITLILKNNEYNPIKLLKYIESNGTKVIYNNAASKILNPIGENEGFIYPTMGHKALYLSISLLKKFMLKTPEMFVLSEGNINQYYFIYHFYNWYAYKHNILGIDNETQELLNKYLYTNKNTRELQLSEIYKLKDAIQQDKSSIEFVIKLCRNINGTQQVINKIKNTGSAYL